MALHEVIIVGSGAAGTAAALQLTCRGIKPLILDVGITRPGNQPKVEGNLYGFRKLHDSFQLQIGNGFQNLLNVLARRDLPAKLITPNACFVTQSAQEMTPLDEEDFSAIQSFAKGGLANAWGAGLYRFTEEDLHGFPFQQKDLQQYYTDLTREIGVCGVEDDLAPFFGSADDLLPPLKLAYNSSKLYHNYLHRRDKLHNAGFYLGRPRLGVLTEPRNGRPAFEYNNLEFWQELPAIYTPLTTLEALILVGKVDYIPAIHVDCWSAIDKGIRVDGVRVGSDEVVSFTGKRLVLAAGAINTAKIVLTTRNDYHTCLTLLENPALQIPFVLPASAGRKLEVDAFGLVQLNMIWRSEEFGCTLQGSLMEITSPMRAEFFNRFPLSARANLSLIKYLLPSMILMQLYFPTSAQPSARLWLQENGRLRIQGQANQLDIRRLARLWRIFGRLNAWTHPRLVVRVPTGHAIHYAGTLPMKERPKEYECDPRGKLGGEAHVYVADSAVFTALPAKNMSFTMMANAMRIADCVVESLSL